MALGLCGQRQTLDSLDEATTEAQVCKTYYGNVRNMLLGSFAWSFATKRVVLALSTQTRAEWAYAYIRPADCLRPQYLYVGDPRPAPELREPFAEELTDGADGSLILTNLATASLLYSVVSPVALWSDEFVDALSAHLAVRVAMALPVKPQLGLALRQHAAIALAHAKAVDANSHTPPVAPDAEHIRQRTGV